MFESHRAYSPFAIVFQGFSIVDGVRLTSPSRDGVRRYVRQRPRNRPLEGLRKTFVDGPGGVHSWAEQAAERVRLILRELAVM